MKLIIDRFEGSYAVCENKDMTMVNILKTLLPSSVQEGDVLIFDGTTYIIDPESTENRKQHIKELMSDIWSD